MYDLIIFIVLLALGYGFGRYAESKHYKSIIKREKELNKIPAVATRIPPIRRQDLNSQLVAGNVVISIDYFKRFIAGLRNIFGGRVTSYETLLDRARREAILRMKEEAEKLNAELVFNIKLETSSIHKGRGNSIGSVEVLAYGTALYPS
ncbi:MAG: YbjQ family protein [Gammaproteobacteria bacterium]|nr:YbjQ family protein [Gammaproteobacteria bacterium]MCW8986888.1 YbjQ family protein [Gammaproteobacteria bacterium]MCW9030901.1 YbjQ family protein [Gammaproteobacteria bacterium]